MITYVGVAASVLLLALLIVAELRRAAGRSNRLLVPPIAAVGFATVVLTLVRLALIILKR